MPSDRQAGAARHRPQAIGSSHASHAENTVATTVTIGYDVPWRQVHRLMLDAAGATAGISQELPPFVLQTSLNDFHISYELSAYVVDVDTYRSTLSDLLGAIQDQFAGAGVEILSPGYNAMRNGNGSTVPPWPAKSFGTPTPTPPAAG
jgi:small-conductance mechanosensitive channel